MAFINPYIKVNTGGIPRLEAIGVSTDSNDNLVYNFNPHKFLNYPYAGLLLFKLPAASTTSTGTALYFTSNGGNKVQVYDSHGVALPSTSKTITLGGIFIGWYSDGNLQLLSGLSETA